MIATSFAHATGKNSYVIYSWWQIFTALCCFITLSFCTQHFIIAGDFNIDLLKDSVSRNKYCDLLCDYHLTQLIDNPTRLSQYSATLIDHTLCAPDIPVHSVSQATGLSDHCIQLVDFLVSVQRLVSTHRWVWSFHNCDWEAVRRDLKHDFLV